MIDCALSCVVKTIVTLLTSPSLKFPAHSDCILRSSKTRAFPFLTVALGPRLRGDSTTTVSLRDDCTAENVRYWGLTSPVPPVSALDVDIASALTWVVCYKWPTRPGKWRRYGAVEKRFSLWDNVMLKLVHVLLKLHLHGKEKPLFSSSAIFDIAPDGRGFAPHSSSLSSHNRFRTGVATIAVGLERVLAILQMETDGLAPWIFQPGAVSCIPTLVCISDGCCEFCHWDFAISESWSSLPHMLCYRRKRNTILDAIDTHSDIRLVSHLSMFGPMHDVWHVCRVCYWLVSEKGRRHYFMHVQQGLRTLTPR